MINKHELISILEECKAHDGLDNLMGEQGIICTNNAFSQLKRLARRDIASGIVQKSKYFDLIVACLESPISENNGQEQKHVDELREIINLAHSEKLMERPLSLSEVCKYINTSQASLYRICQEYFVKHHSDKIC